MVSGVDSLGLPSGTITPRLVSALYVEAMVLADEVRAYFDESGREERDHLPPLLRVTFSCESLKVTTRLMHIIAWLLNRRAVDAGELSEGDALHETRRLGNATESDEAILRPLPARGQLLIRASQDLYERVARLDDGLVPASRPINPARSLIDRLEAAF